MFMERNELNILLMISSNLEITKRQRRLLDELNKCEDELSGQDLHRELYKSKNEMGLATVYRNLQVLVKQGLVRSRHLPTGEVLYAPVERDIHHLTCVSCGGTTRLKGCPVQTKKVPKQASEKFHLLFHTLEYFGLCQDCSQSTND